jgi:CHASE3 domain sensor protein
MSNTSAPRFAPGARALIIAGSVLVLVLIAAFLWQASVYSSETDDADKHREVATIIKSAEADGAAAGALLQQFVETGDETLLPQMQAKTDSGVRQLTTAIALAGGDPDQFVQQGGAFVQAAGRVVALRQAGDIQGAATALSQISTEFEAFIAAQDAFVADEEAKAVTADNAASDAEDAATWIALAIAADFIAVICMLAVTMIRRGSRRTQAAAA